MTASRRRNDFRVILVEKLLDFTTKNFLVAITAKTLGKTSGFCTKQLEYVKDILGGQSLERENSIVPSRTVDKDQAVVGTPHDHGVTKTDINVDLVQIVIKGTVDGTTPLCFTKGGLCAKSWWELSGIGPFHIIGDLESLTLYGAKTFLSMTNRTMLKYEAMPAPTPAAQL